MKLLLIFLTLLICVCANSMPRGIREIAQARGDYELISYYDSIHQENVRQLYALVRNYPNSNQNYSETIHRIVSSLNEIDREYNTLNIQNLGTQGKDDAYNTAYAVIKSTKRTLPMAEKALKENDKKAHAKLIRLCDWYENQAKYIEELDNKN